MKITVIDRQNVSELRLQLINIYSNSDIFKNVPFEVVPYIYMLTDMAIYDGGGTYTQRQYATNLLSELLIADLPDDLFGVFDNRISLYGEIVAGKPIRGECIFGGEKQNPNNPYLKLAIAFTDILINPKAAENYDSAAFFTQGINPTDIICASAEALHSAGATVMAYVNDIKRNVMTT